MQEVGVRELKNRASRLIEEVEAGEPIVITRRGRPAAVLVPVAEAESLLVSRAEEFVRMRLGGSAGRASDLRALVEEKRDEIRRIAARHGARNVRLFGSAARGEGDRESDIDLLVDLDQDRDLFDLGGLVNDLEAMLGRKVDVATEAGLRPRVRERILREAAPV